MTPEQFLYYEASLLDRRAHEEWLALYTDDAEYWVPQRDGDDPTRDVSIVFDDWSRLHGRVVRLSSGFAYSQEPPSRTSRLIGNVRVKDDGADGLVEVEASMIIVEVRRGTQKVYAGATEHFLRPAADSFLIRRKVVRLVNGDLPLGNVSFLL